MSAAQDSIPPYIAADFNKRADDGIVFADEDNLVDAKGRSVSLAEGLHVYAFDPDTEDGVDGFIVIPGTITANTVGGGFRYKKWRCRLEFEQARFVAASDFDKLARLNL